MHVRRAVAWIFTAALAVALTTTIAPRGPIDSACSIKSGGGWCADLT